MLGDKIKTLRKQSRMSQNELAEKLYVSRTLVTKWESGRRYPQRDVLEKMAAVFGLSYDEFIKDDRAAIDAREELSEDLDDGSDEEGSGGDEALVKAMADKISGFLRTLPASERKIFIRRYYYYDTVDTISASEGKAADIVRTTLSEIRLRLINYLEKEGF